jgi:hypothetical protein
MEKEKNIVPQGGLIQYNGTIYRAGDILPDDYKPITFNEGGANAKSISSKSSDNGGEIRNNRRNR